MPQPTIPNPITRLLLAIRSVGLMLWLGGMAALTAQTTVLTLAPSDPARSFNTGPTGAGANLTNVLRTERLDLSIAQTPTPPAGLAPRRLAVWIGFDDPTPTSVAQGTIFIDFSAALSPFTLVDSFADPFAPTLSAANGNSVAFTAAANLFDPGFPIFPGVLPTITLQAVAEDTPGVGVGLVLSNPVRLNLVDPQGVGLGPTLTGTSPSFGPESGGTAVLITGQNFPAQTDWVAFPPSVRFGGTPATLVTVLDSQTVLATAPGVAPSSPPNTSAGPVDVTFQNNGIISPSGVPATLVGGFLYQSAQAPTLLGIDSSIARPEGGEPRVLTGTWFLNGATVTFRSQTNPLLSASVMATQISAPGSSGEQTLGVVTPPFCSGPVEVFVSNVDGQTAGPLVLTYLEQPPIPVSGAPSVTLPAYLMGQTWSVIPANGSPISIFGNDFLSSQSPLATASTVGPGLFFATQTFLDGVLQPGVVATSSTTLAGPTIPVSDSGVNRPSLGFRTLEVQNPPCVRFGNAAPIPNPPCLPAVPPCQVIRQSNGPPSIVSMTPPLGTRRGRVEVIISGTNFFSVDPVATSQLFGGPNNPLTTVDPRSLIVPAVRFGNRFATEVTVLDNQTLRVIVPPAPTGTGSLSVPVEVISPDLQRSSSPVNYTYLPPLTGSSVFGNLPPLDGALLVQLALGNVPIPGVNGTPSFLVILNPSRIRDGAQDSATFGGLLPPLSPFSYDLVFLLNTRDPSTPPGVPRVFTFPSIDLPATVDLQGGIAVIPPIDPSEPPIGAQSAVPITPGRYRVIIKAVGFELAPNGRVAFDPADNPPLVLASQGTFRLDALLDLAGDAWMIEGFVQSQTRPLRVRVDRTLPPAGAGRGGRGGAYFPEGLTSLPPPNFGISSTQLSGQSGGKSLSRFPNGIPSGGGAAPGAGPIGFIAGAGGGAGARTNGSAGQTGTSPGGLAGASVGNATNGPPTLPGIPLSDAEIFGGPYGLLGPGTAFTSGLFAGGDGGGGGAGSLSVLVPSLSLGGRGGHGGGSVVLIADGVLSFGSTASVLVNGEQGQMGIEVFPVSNSDPFTPVNLPGAGGSGAGGTIFAIGNGGVVFASGSSAGTSAGRPAAPAFDARGGASGPQLGPEPITNLGVAAGGAGSAGRIRFAFANLATPAYTTALRTDIESLFQGSGGAPPLLIPAPFTPGTFPVTFVTFPNP